MSLVRPRTTVDLDDCVAVLQRVHEKDGYPVQGTANAKAFLCQKATQQAWVAERGGGIVGHVAVSVADEDDVAVKLWRGLHPSEPVALLERLFVDPRARGRGAASELMEMAVEWARSHQVRLVLFALAKDEGAMELYERLGWSRFGTTEYSWDQGKRMEAMCYVSPP